jgi:hypothetical protein
MFTSSRAPTNMSSFTFDSPLTLGQLIYVKHTRPLRFGVLLSTDQYTATIINIVSPDDVKNHPDAYRDGRCLLYCEKNATDAILASDALIYTGQTSLNILSTAPPYLCLFAITSYNLWKI